MRKAEGRGQKAEVRRQRVEEKGLLHIVYSFEPLVMFRSMACSAIRRNLFNWQDINQFRDFSSRVSIAPERSRGLIASLSEQCPPVKVSVGGHFLAVPSD